MAWANRPCSLPLPVPDGMSTGLSVALGFSVGGAVALLATPGAIAVARRTDFYDRPREYRKHAAPTPLLGGAAVLVALLAAALLLGGTTSRLLVLLGCGAALWLLGTLDDLRSVPP